MNRGWELHGVGRTAEKRVYCWSSIEMRDVLLLEQLPDLWIVNFAQAIVGSPDRGYSPWERPAWNSLVS